MQWLHLIYIYINAGKTQALIFLPFRWTIQIGHVDHGYDFFVNGEWVEIVREFKYLRIHFDISTNTDNHVSVCYQRAKQQRFKSVGVASNFISCIFLV